MTPKQQTLIAALLTEPTYTAAASKAGVSRATLYRWMKLPMFRAAYHQAARVLFESANARLQAASGEAAEALLSVIRQGRRDGDRIRAAVALWDRAHRGLTAADLLYGPQATEEQPPADPSDVVRLLAKRLEQVDCSQLPTAQKARLTASLSDALLRALGVDVIDKRLEALQAVLLDRKEKQA